MQDFIIKLLDLKEEDLDSIHTVSKMNQADFLITLKVKDHVCPQCGCFTRYVKDYRTRKLKHKVFVNFSSTIFYRQRRYLCRNCQKSFVEKSPFTGNRHTMTPATVINILNDLKPYNSTYSSVAKKYDVSVTTVIDIFDRHVQIPRKNLTDILCWDEFYFNSHAKKKYAFIIMDFKKNISLISWNQGGTKTFMTISFVSLLVKGITSDTSSSTCTATTDRSAIYSLKIGLSTLLYMLI